MASTTTKMASRMGPKLGRKQIFLPNFHITLLNTPKIAPMFASFLVPLNMNKLDLRDYLWNMYGLHALGVRSYIQLQKIQQDKTGAKRPSPRRWHRPKSIKRMMVEMAKPFVFPEVKDFTLWDKKTFEAAEKEQDEFGEAMRPEARKTPTKERRSMREQARALIEGKDTWRPTPTSNQWDIDGEEIEVEQHVDINKESKN